ncbi:MAG: 16S rRNA (adenine(1518)-N(6)/adenine(1519)-N(6))-dimethyltransferase RsmA [Clostridia bacterium]|nr:16S rRNA (adenine(1518)-N(6)/adenine(1519)-N(6))-dimethyltransferase RsmA [Clostridia bacterium]
MRASLEFVREYFESSQTRANRALGQNFCINGSALLSALNSVCLKPYNVLEIGAGLGALTELLILRAKSVTAIELDSHLAGELKSLNCKAINADALKLDTSFIDEGWAVAGNLPYYITTPLIEKFLTTPASAHLYMVQREAAQRFFSKPSEKNYCPITILSEIFFTPKLVLELSPSDYYPQPEVSSAIVALTARSDAPAINRKAFLSFVRRCLNMRRKTLKNNLGEVENADELLKRMNLAPKIRAEALSPLQFLELYQNLFQ